MGIRLQDKTALVTGATSNIGRAIVTAFAAVAHMFVVSGRSWRRGTEVVDQIREAGRCRLSRQRRSRVRTWTVIDVDGAPTSVAVIAGA